MRHKKIYLILVGCVAVVLLLAGYSYALDGNTFGSGNYAITAAGSLERIEGKYDLAESRNTLLANAKGEVFGPPVVPVKMKNVYLPLKLTPKAFDGIVAASEFQKIIESVDKDILGPYKLKFDAKIINVYDVE